MFPEDEPPGELVPDRFSGLLAEGTITDDDVNQLDDFFGGSVADLVESIKGGDTFVRVNTATFPDSAIEGDIQ